MRPERFDRISPLLTRSLQLLVVISLTVIALQTRTVHAAQSMPKSSPGSVYDTQSFIKELQRLESDLESARKSTETLRSYRESLPEAWAVDTVGRHYDVPTDLLVSRLLKAERQPEIRDEQLNQAREYLRALAEESASVSGQPTASTDSARAKLHAILARPEYTRTRQESWWEKLRARINEILLDALGRIFRQIGGQTSLGYILLWTGVCAAAIFIAYFIFRSWFRTARVAEMALEAAAVPLRSWREWVFAAREAATRGDYRMAIHCAYWAGVMRLQEIGALAPDRAKTPREHLLALAKSKLILPEPLATRQQALSLLTSRLEKVWYGYQTATEADFRDSLTQLEALGCHLS
jgi:hypothetical protein